MKRILFSVLLALFAPLGAKAQVPGYPTFIMAVYNSGTIASGSVAQTIGTCSGLGPAAGGSNCWTLVQPNGYSLQNVLRCVQNPGSAFEDLFIAFGTAASATTQDLPAGSAGCAVWAGTVSVFAATAGHAYSLSEYQW